MQYVVALDGGGTRTSAGLYEERTLRAEAEGPASNPILNGTDACVQVVVDLTNQLLASRPSRGIATLACGISGAGLGLAHDAIAPALAKAFPSVRILVTNDVAPLLFANAGHGPCVLAIAGTGSNVRAQHDASRAIVIGGRGVLFGDYGSAYQVAVSALRAAAAAEDGMGPATALQQTLPSAAGLETFRDLVIWGQHASKTTVAALAKAVSEAASHGDAVARSCIETQAHYLAAQMIAAADRACVPDDAPVYFAGGLAEACPLFAEALAARLAATRLRKPPCVAPLRGHRAVLELALAATVPEDVAVALDSAQVPLLPPSERSKHGEQPLDRLNAAAIAARMNHEDTTVAEAVKRQIPAIAALIDTVAGTFAQNGRLIYVGAGTSGRLAALDAAECPPTFGVGPDTVQAIIAGGDAALRRSVEGAEDDGAQAEADLAQVQPPIGPRDTVAGIAASGTTPYTRAAVAWARAAGAKTAFLCCNPRADIAADHVIRLDTGPEVLVGSTRLKAGTATKLVLNMISTGAMALSGRVFEGFMVGMRPSNAKLRDRAVRIVSALSDRSESEAARILEAAQFDIRATVMMARLRITKEDALKRLDRAGGNLRIALDL